jgi:hypothetical protein
MKHMMLDIETLGKGSFAAILSIGAVKFDPFYCPATIEELMETTERFHVRVEGAGTRYGMQMDVDTVGWWMHPDRAAARDAIRAMEEVDLVNALFGLTEFYGSDSFVPVWGNGATFDNVVVSNAYGRVGQERPWRYKADRCFRTLKALAPSIKSTDVGTGHTALDDALAQAWWMQGIVKHLGLINL